MIKRLKAISAVVGSAITMISCAATAPAPVTVTEPKELSQPAVLLGSQPLQAFQKAPYADWYNAEFNTYKTDAAAIQKLKELDLSKYRFTAFVGTWCADSHREFPRLVKVLKEAGYPENQIEIYAVDATKTAPGGEEVPYDVHKIPTFIIQKDGKQIGRIVEFPKSGFLERDLLDILTKTKTDK